MSWPDPNKTVEQNNLEYVKIMDRAVGKAYTLMSPEQWAEYFLRLEGPEGCDFKNNDGKTTWICGGGWDKSYSKNILTKMGFDQRSIDEIFTCVEDLGGHCDCEVLFNAAERIER